MFQLAILLASVVVDADATNYRAMFDTVGAGDTLRLAPGEYRDCLRVSGKHGTGSERIVIEGADVFGGGVVFYGANCTGIRNATIFVEDSSFLTIRNIEIDLEGALANGIRAGYGTTPVHHVTVEGLYVHDNDANNQHSAIGVFATSWDWHIRGNRMERNGLGMYLGDSDGSAPFIRGSIEHNLILDPRGYGFQIKHQVARAAVPGMPQGDSVTIIRHNTIIKAANAGVGPDARPNLLIGDVPPSGVGSNDRYEIYGNFFFENASDAESLFQGEGRLSIHDNIFVNTFSGPAILVQPHNGAVREVAIFHNTFLVSGTAASITGGPASVLGNAAYADGAAFVGGPFADNVEGTRVQAASVFVNATPTLGQLDLYPADESTLNGAPIDLGAASTHTDADLDFNGDPRDGRWRGAYAGFGTNPGWQLAAEAPPGAADPPPRDGGTRDSGASRPQPDGGTERDAGVRSDGGGVRDSGVTPVSPPVEEDEGCSCAAHRSRGPAAGSWLLLAIAVVGLRWTTGRRSRARRRQARGRRSR